MLPRFTAIHCQRSLGLPAIYPLAQTCVNLGNPHLQLLFSHPTSEGQQLLVIKRTAFIDTTISRSPQCRGFKAVRFITETISGFKGCPDLHRFIGPLFSSRHLVNKNACKDEGKSSPLTSGSLKPINCCAR